jgi:hypothetical protein
MLGLGRASQLAGWGSDANIIATANLTSESSINYARKITPTYSYRMEVNSGGSGIGYNTVKYGPASDQYINLTGLTGFTGYNNLNMTMVQHFYLPWTGKTDAFTNGQFRVELRQPSAFGFGKSVIINTGQNNGSGKFYVSVDYPTSFMNMETADSYTNYNNRWLTVIFSTSDTASNFTNWSSSSGSGAVYARIALYDTQTGLLIKKQDQRVDSPPWNLSTLPTQLSFSPDESDYIAIYGYPGGSFADDRDYRIQNLWISMGTMFDPLTTTDTTWLTSNPNKQIGNAVAWLNSQFNDYIYRFDYNPTGEQGVTKIANTDLYVNVTPNGGLNNIYFQSGSANTFLTQYSNTVVLMNGGT